MSEDKMTPEKLQEIQPLEIQDSFSYTGEELKRMRSTRMSAESGGEGSILDNLGARSDLKTDPLEVAMQTDLTNDEKRKRIEILMQNFHSSVAQIVNRFSRPGEDPLQVNEELDRVRNSRSDIVAERLTPAREPVRRNGR